MTMLGHHKKNEKTEVCFMKKCRMSEHLKKKQMNKNPPPPTSLKPTEQPKREQIGSYCFLSYIMRKIFCETERKLIQICVGKFFFTQYIIKLQNTFVQVATKAKD